MDSFMYKILAVSICLILFSGCQKEPKTAPEQTVQITEAERIEQQKKALLEDFSGVWTDHHDLMTVYYDGTAIHLIVNDEAKEVKLGDIDLQNETINLLVTKIDDYQQGIFTLRRLWNEDKTKFTLAFTSFDGESGELGFVRKIGNDDKTRIENIYTHQFNNHYEDDASTPAYDVSQSSDYSEYEDLIEADRIATAAANQAKMAAYEAEMAAQAATEIASLEATQAAYEAVEAASEVYE